MIETPPPFDATPEVVSLLETLVDTKQLSDIQEEKSAVGWFYFLRLRVLK